MAPRVAQLGPWSPSFDPNLRATEDGETHLPFRFHVRPERNDTGATKDGFHRFLQLPVELQQHTLSFCDAATLFQLMHTSYSTRQEAKKLFWSDPSSRYIIDGQWLQAGGHPRYTNYNLDALTHMQYIEVNFVQCGIDFIRKWKDGVYYDDIHKGDEQRAAFWATLRRLFPRVIDVVLDDTRVERCREEPPPEKPIRLATGSPHGISVRVCQLRGVENVWYSPETRHLWQQNGGNNTMPTWDLVNTSWNPRRIMPPMEFRYDLVGAYQKYDHDEMDLDELRFARDIHAMHATAAYYLDIAQTPCICLWPACGLQFGHPEEWMAHYLEASPRRDDHNGTVPLPPNDSIRAVFSRHDMMLAQKRHQLSEVKLEMRAAWGEPDSPERSRVTHEFLHQLWNDPWYPEKSPERRAIWRRYQADMDGDEMSPFYELPSTHE